MVGGGFNMSTRECDLVEQYILEAEVSDHLLLDLATAIKMFSTALSGTDAKYHVSTSDSTISQ
jgi:hypothetical protein